MLIGAVVSLLSLGNFFVCVESLNFAFFGSVHDSSNNARSDHRGCDYRGMEALIVGS